MRSGSPTMTAARSARSTPRQRACDNARRNGAHGLAIARELWVANALDSTVSRVDVETATLLRRSRRKSPGLDHRRPPVGLGRDPIPGVVSRSTRGPWSSTTPVGGSPTGGGGPGSQLWLGSQSLAAHRGGTVTLVHTRRITSIRRSRETSCLWSRTADPRRPPHLRPRARTGGHATGPDLAVNMPVPTNGGTIYTFRLRPGIRYSDGRLVQAADFRRAIERAFRLGACQ